MGRKRIIIKINKNDILQKNHKAIFWLARETQIAFPHLAKLLILREKQGNLDSEYTIKYLRKSDGGKRQISVPSTILNFTQKRIHQRILRQIPVSPHASGFSGGGIIKAITPHLESKTMLRVDCQDAFPTISREYLSSILADRRVLQYGGVDCEAGQYKVVEFGDLSKSAARIILDLTFFDGHLPQGAPTSPRLFDIACRWMDERLSKLAENVNGVYTRYADNIFFSLKKRETFDRPLARAILKIIRGRRSHSPGFYWHKLRITKLGQNAQRMLGLNMMENKIHNTRDFKRHLRKAVHHVNWLIDHDMHCGEPWSKLHGLMSFAVKETLPAKLLAQYQETHDRIANKIKEEFCL
jgi:hypothetical protein